MTTHFTSFTHLLRTQIAECERVSWFLYEALEREHRLTIEAVSACSPAVVLAWMSPMQPALFFLAASPLTIPTKRA